MTTCSLASLVVECGANNICDDFNRGALFSFHISTADEQIRQLTGCIRYKTKVNKSIFGMVLFSISESHDIFQYGLNYFNSFSIFAPKISKL